MAEGHGSTITISKVYVEVGPVVSTPVIVIV